MAFIVGTLGVTAFVMAGISDSRRTDALERRQDNAKPFKECWLAEARKARGAITTFELVAVLLFATSPIAVFLLAL